MEDLFMVLDASGGKTPAQKYDEMEGYFKGKFGLPRGKTMRYSPDGTLVPRLTLTNGALAFPVIPEAVEHLPNAPQKFPTPVTWEELAARGLIPRSVPPTGAGATAIPVTGATTFLRRHKYKVAAGTAAAAAIGAALWHYLA